MGLLVLELIALVVVVSADDAVHGRPPVASWGTSLRVIGAAFAAVAVVTLLDAAVDAHAF